MASHSADHDLVVVGGGMIGSAAARHAAEAGLSVALVGADEPADWTAPDGPFASHYDAGRITRIIDGDPVWAELAAASIGRYADLERRTGISFHDPVGLAWMKPATTATPALADGISRGAAAREVSPDWLRAEFGIEVPKPAESVCIFEGAPAGLVNPRRLVEAERAAAVLAGADVITQPAAKIERSTVGFAVSGRFGSVAARHVLMATGMYGAALIGVKLALIRQPRTAVRLEIEHGALPSLIVNQVHEPDIADIYWVPPVPYPDGKVMLKIGGTHAATEPFGADHQIAKWFAGDGMQSEALALRAVVSELIPTATVNSWDSMPCVVTQTPSKYPYVGWVDDGIAVAVGGNGSAAKSCDEIGRRAASLFVPGMCDPAELEPFTPMVDT